MQQPETLIFTRLARWPGPSCGPAGQGRFGAGPALTGACMPPQGQQAEPPWPITPVGAAQGTRYRPPSNWIAALMPRKHEERSMKVS